MKQWQVGVLAVGLLCAGSVFAEEGVKGAGRPERRPEGPGMMGMMPPRLAEELGLTADQKEQIKKLEEEGMAFRKQQHEKLLAILTPEQKEKLEKHREQMRERMKERRGGEKGAPPAKD